MTFLPMFERHEPEVLDHTAIITAKTCFRKYQLKIVFGFRDNRQTGYISFGSAYHTFREVLEKSFASGMDEEKCLEAAMEATANSWTKAGGDPPVGIDYDYLTGERLFKSCLKAFEWWKKEKLAKRIEVIAIEQEFVVTMSDGKTKTGGRADQIVRWNGKLWGRDFKSTSKNAVWYQRLLEPNDQITRYTLGEGLLCGEPVSGQLIELLFNSKKEGPKIIPLIATRTPDQLEKWEREQIFFVHLLDEMREMDMYPMCESHCPYCEFHSVCKQVSEQSMADVLKQHFKQKKWDFTRTQETV
jgi:PD-(D/E)XK nuclease superfamily protein